MKNDNNTAPRIRLVPLRISHDELILELVNSSGWLQFIGERNVKTLEDARGYIQKILDSPIVNYYVIEVLSGGNQIGIITLIQRDYLDAPDIGYALLPQYENQGFASEGAALFLSEFFHNPANRKVYALTQKDNTRSIRVVEKLGFIFTKEITVDGKPLSQFTKMSS